MITKKKYVSVRTGDCMSLRDGQANMMARAEVRAQIVQERQPPQQPNLQLTQDRGGYEPYPDQLHAPHLGFDRGLSAPSSLPIVISQKCLWWCTCTTGYQLVDHHRAPLPTTTSISVSHMQPEMIKDGDAKGVKWDVQHAKHAY